MGSMGSVYELADKRLARNARRELDHDAFFPVVFASGPVRRQGLDETGHLETAQSHVPGFDFLANPGGSLAHPENGRYGPRPSGTVNKAVVNIEATFAPAPAGRRDGWTSMKFSK